MPLTEVTLASETPLGARETQHTKRTTRLGTCELIVRGYVLTTRHTSRSTAPRATLRLALLHFLGRCKQRNAISEAIETVCLRSHCEASSTTNAHKCSNRKAYEKRTCKLMREKSFIFSVVICCVVLDVFFPRGVRGVYGGQGSAKTCGDICKVMREKSSIFCFIIFCVVFVP